MALQPWVRRSMSVVFALALILVSSAPSSRSASRYPFSYGYLYWSATNRTAGFRTMYIASTTFAYCTADARHEESITADARKTFDAELQAFPGFVLETTPSLLGSDTRERAEEKRLRHLANREANGFKVVTVQYSWAAYSTKCR